MKKDDYLAILIFLGFFVAGLLFGILLVSKGIGIGWFLIVVSGIGLCVYLRLTPEVIKQRKEQAAREEEQAGRISFPPLLDYIIQLVCVRTALFLQQEIIHMVNAMSQIGKTLLPLPQELVTR